MFYYTGLIISYDGSKGITPSDSIVNTNVQDMNLYIYIYINSIYYDIIYVNYFTYINKFLKISSRQLWLTKINKPNLNDDFSIVRI